MTFETIKFLEEVKDHYLQSSDFNGVPIRYFKKKYNVETDNLRELLLPLIKEEKVSLVFTNNPHIKQFPDLDTEKQIQKLYTDEFEGVCVYPAKKYLEQVVDKTVYNNRPYTSQLAMGAAQIEFRAFDLTILESYRNDPRYYYENNAIGGRIGVNGDHSEQNMQLPQQDKTHLQTFGFCYDETGRRAVAVLLRYLKSLSSEHQTIWKFKELSGPWKLHPDYYRYVMGIWEGGGISIFDALLEELKLINQMCEAMNKPPLFKSDFSEDRPKEFSFLIRPTRKEFDNFVKEIDKMISENLNKKFFKNEIDREEISSKNEDGTDKGTIGILESWLNKFYYKFNPEVESFDKAKSLLEPFKTIRKRRSAPSHAVVADEFNSKFMDEQKNILISTYESLSTLRQIFNSHPNCVNNNFNIHRCLLEHKIWTQ